MKTAHFNNAFCLQATDVRSKNSTKDGQQSLRASIVNLADETERIGFHGYLPDKADITSFSMSSGGITYHAKKSSREVAQQSLKEAQSKNHNAAVFFPQILPGKLENFMLFLFIEILRQQGFYLMIESVCLSFLSINNID